MEELEASNEALVQTRDALWGEMELARKIQTVLLPCEPAMNDYDVTAYTKPADEVGGDYYDIINAGGRDWLVIGDVSGHGVTAGLIMMMAQTAIHTTLEQNPEIPPSRLLTLINRVITGNIKMMSENKYMTITVFASHQGGRFIFSGLHLDILIYRTSTGNVETYQTNGMWIGIMDDIQSMIEDQTLILEPNDVMLIYTDGITESFLKGVDEDQRDYFGDDRLTEILLQLGERSGLEIKDGILKALQDFHVIDDISLVVIKRKD